VDTTTFLPGKGAGSVVGEGLLADEATITSRFAKATMWDGTVPCVCMMLCYANSIGIAIDRKW
jgi:hypothetical protein